jgi:hypothetical protein
MMLTPNQVSINYFMDQLNIQLKVCNICKLSLSVDKFGKASGNEDGLRGQCKSCRAKYCKEYYQDNKDEILEQKKEYYQDNKDERLKYNKEYYQDNKAEIKEKKKEYRRDNKAEIAERNKKYYQDNKAEKLKKGKEYYQDNKAKILEQKKEYQKNKYNTDPNFKAKENLRKATYRLFKRADKNKKTLKILGVSSYEDALSRLLKTMPEGYTLQDFLEGKLAIDHKIPLAWFDLTIESELMKAGNINNLQLLTKEQNQEKLDKYGHMPDGSIILYEDYEDWVKTKVVEINE